MTHSLRIVVTPVVLDSAQLNRRGWGEHLVRGNVIVQCWRYLAKETAMCSIDALHEMKKI